MTLTTMLAAVRDILGETTADFWTDSQLTAQLNEAMYRFNTAEKWPWLVTEVTGASIGADDTAFELQAGVGFSRHINFLLTPDGTTIPYSPKRVSAAEGYKLRGIYATTTNWPQYFYVSSVPAGEPDGQFIWVARFIPTPNVDIDVEYQYIRPVSELSAGTDEPDMPIEYHRALVHHAAAQAWLKELSGGSKADEQMQLYFAILDQARKEFLEQAPDDFIVMGGEEPQEREMDVAQYTLTRISETLGD